MAPSFGGYVVVEALGRGGMGVVYLARDTTSDRLVALKTVPVAEPEALTGIRREIHALGRLDHPGIVRILDQGMADGVPWYAMERIDGVDLLSYVRGALEETAGPTERMATAPDPVGSTQKLSPAERVLPGRIAARADRGALDPGALSRGLDVVARLSESLAYLHGEGIVHRDLKPANVLVRAGGDPVLVDFGLSSATQVSSRETLQVAGDAAGTAAYIAPEQLRGEVVDARADLYSLGCILYEILTGAPPFVSGSVGELVRMHLSEWPDPPSRRAANLPPRIDDLTMKLLAKDPRERPGHAAAVAAEIDRLTGAVAPRAPSPVARPFLYRARFVERKLVAEALDADLRRASSGNFSAALLLGESGIGKTREASALATQAALDGFLVLAGECLPGAGEQSGPVASPLSAWLGPIRRLAEWCGSCGHEVGLQVFGKTAKVLCAFAPEIATLPFVDALPAPSELPPEEARLRLVSAVAAAMTAAARTTRTLIILDDLQWADPLSLDVLAVLLRGRDRRGTLFVLGTCRVEEPEALARLAGMEPHVLGRLDHASVGRMVGEMLALDPVPDDLVAFLARRSEGNPFFLAEHLRALIASQLLSMERGAWRLHVAPGSTLDELPLPATLHDLLHRRLASLDELALRLAEAASVLGRQGDLRDLAAVFGGSDADFFGALETLRVRAVAEHEGGAYRLVHDKLREVAYGRLAADARRALHLRAARALSGGDAAAERLGEIARHHELGGDRDRARTSYLAAARSMVSRHATQDAVRLYRAYLALVDAPSAEAIAARQELVEQGLYPLGDLAGAIEEHERGVSDAQSLDDAAALARGLERLAHLYQITGNPSRAEAAAARSLAIATERDDPVQHVRSLRAVAAISDARGDSDASTAAYERALSIARDSGNRLDEGRLLVSVGIHNHGLGRSADAERSYRTAIDLLRDAGDRVTGGIALGNLASLYAEQGRHEDAVRLFEEALAIHRDVGDRFSEAYVLANLATNAREQGRASARADLEAARSVASEIGDAAMQATLLGQVAAIDLDDGTPDRAEERLGQALAIVRASGNQRLEAWVLGELGIVARVGGRHAVAAERSEQAVSLYAASGDRQGESLVLSELARALTELERFEESERAARLPSMRRRRSETRGRRARPSSRSRSPWAGAARPRPRPSTSMPPRPASRATGMPCSNACASACGYRASLPTPPPGSWLVLARSLLAPGRWRGAASRRSKPKPRAPPGERPVLTAIQRRRNIRGRSRRGVSERRDRSGATASACSPARDGRVEPVNDPGARSFLWVRNRGGRIACPSPPGRRNLRPSPCHHGSRHSSTTIARRCSRRPTASLATPPTRRTCCRRSSSGSSRAARISTSHRAPRATCAAPRSTPRSTWCGPEASDPPSRSSWCRPRGSPPRNVAPSAPWRIARLAIASAAPSASSIPAWRRCSSSGTSRAAATSRSPPPSGRRRASSRSPCSARVARSGSSSGRKGSRRHE
ncbi:MAG: protein kinase [Acidobacteriota bacterium]